MCKTKRNETSEFISRTLEAEPAQIYRGNPTSRVTNTESCTRGYVDRET